MPTLSRNLHVSSAKCTHNNFGYHSRIGRAVVNLSSEEPGTASHVKSICNIIIVSLIEAVAEAHVLAEKTGLKIECLQNALKIVWGGPYGIYSDRMSSGDYHHQEVRRFLVLLLNAEMEEFR